MQRQGKERDTRENGRGPRISIIRNLENVGMDFEGAWPRGRNTILDPIEGMEKTMWCLMRRLDGLMPTRRH